MKLSALIGERFKEWPSEAQLASHGLLIRGGYMRQVAGGIYTLLPPAKRVAAKIENIIRQEMDRIDGQEILMPVVLPRELWDESGRYESVGRELLRFRDRTGHDMLLAMTHEEAAVHLARTEAKSYLKYPFMIYQIQTKYRDEARSRGGLIRVREFTMKDAYSFHTSWEDLEKYYYRCHEAYERIYKRAGLGHVVSVKSDSGMMGGAIAHEFMFLCDDGEDTIAICPACGYRANMEVATGILDPVGDMGPEGLDVEEVATPGCKDIDSLCKFIGIPEKMLMKAVVFTKETTGTPVIVFVRGDLEVNEAKVRRLIGSDVSARVDEDGSDGICYGYIGPVGLDMDKFEVYFDESLRGMYNVVCGANKVDTHYKNVDLRQLPAEKFADVSKVTEQMVCPQCGKAHITLKNGIEVGNIFQLGDKYSKTMGMTYADKDGSLKTPIMGCYGIGVGRLLASVIEDSHDDYGPIWPISIAPWQVHINAIKRADDQVRQLADGLYEQLSGKGFEVLYDDRDLSAGVQFADADLLGTPIKVIVSPRNLKDGVVEIKTRDKSIAEKVPVENAASRVAEIAAALQKRIDDTL
ncbi:proline--tRNA ligase [Neobittarella massiliensis]|uniref:proline--tRNA ligase n=1 Tax=Neobittarella massiliensis (ex Bilen et al. 2018) TaxID=2041842 RepID=UPI000CF6CBE6|nr:proline--tRNA ligase [Neobittarella massiliensis]